MPFGMGPAGWFMLPYIAQWWGWWLRRWPRAPYIAPYWWTYAPVPMTPQDELSALRAQAQALESELEAIRRRIEELEKQVEGS